MDVRQHVGDFLLFHIAEAGCRVVQHHVLNSGRRMRLPVLTHRVTGIYQKNKNIPVHCRNFGVNYTPLPDSEREISMAVVDSTLDPPLCLGLFVGPFFVNHEKNTSSPDVTRPCINQPVARAWWRRLKCRAEAQKAI